MNKENQTQTPEQQAAEIRRAFARRKSECIEISVKLKQTIDILETTLKMDDIDTPHDNGLAKVNVYNFIHNILIWYPKQSVPFLTTRLLTLYRDALSLQRKPHPLIAWLNRHIHSDRRFRLILRLFTDHAKGDILRIRSITAILPELARLQGMLDDIAEGETVNVLHLARLTSYLHILLPKRTSEIVRFTLDLYRDCEKINARQIAGFSDIAKKTPKVS